MVFTSNVKTVNKSGLKKPGLGTPGCRMEPKAFPNAHDLIWFNLLFMKTKNRKQKWHEAYVLSF